MIQCILKNEVLQHFCDTQPVSPLMFSSLSTLPSLSLAKESLEERYDAKSLRRVATRGHNWSKLTAVLQRSKKEASLSVQSALCCSYLNMHTAAYKQEF